MARSAAATVEDYLAELPEDRRAVVAAARALVLEHLPTGYAERMNWGMIAYEVPLDLFAATYNKQPLCYVALAAQKNYYSLYLPCCGPDAEGAEFRAGFEAAGKKLDMGKGCVRFRKLDDLATSVVGRAVAAQTPAEFVAAYKLSRQG